MLVGSPLLSGFVKKFTHATLLCFIFKRLDPRGTFYIKQNVKTANNLYKTAIYCLGNLKAFKAQQISWIRQIVSADDSKTKWTPLKCAVITDTFKVRKPMFGKIFSDHYHLVISFTVFYVCLHSHSETQTEWLSSRYLCLWIHEGALQE